MHLSPQAEVNVFEAEPDLIGGLGPEAKEQAKRHAIASALTLASGPWDGRTAVGYPREVVALMVVDGLLIRRVRVGGSTPCAELLGAGDLLWPSGESVVSLSVGVKGSYAVIEPTVLALLDQRFFDAASRWPGLTQALVGRGLRWPGPLDR